MDEQFSQILEQVLTVLATYGLDVLAAFVILFAGWWFSNWTRRFLQNRLTKSGKLDLMLVSFASSFVKYAILAFTITAVLNQFGVQTTSLVAVLGAAGLAIGLALQGTLSNVAAGVMLLVFRPFRVGDFVEVAGVGGTVKDVSLFITEMSSPDNIQITIPNGQIWGNVIRNYSINDTRRLDLAVGVGYSSGLNHAFKVIQEAMKKDPRILMDPAPSTMLTSLGASSLDLTVRCWTKTADYWAVRFDLLKAVKETLDAEGIEIPFPQQVSYQYRMEKKA